MLRKTLIGLAASLALAAGSSSALAQGTAFTYQGQLKNSGSAVSSPTDMQFSLWTAATGGSQVGSTVTQTNVTVTAGLFTSSIDFGVNPYTSSQNLFLQIAVRNPAGVGSYVNMGSRQLLTPSPFSLATRGINVDAAGLVGIGTSTPLATLGVQSRYDATIDGLAIDAGYAPDPGQYRLGIRPYVIGGGNVGYAFRVKNGANVYGVMNMTRDGVNIGNSLSVDSDGANPGALLNQPGLTFGGFNVGEGIASKRNAGGNQFGLDFYTNYINRLSITQSGNVGIGTTGGGSRLNVAGPAGLTGQIGNMAQFQNPTGNRLSLAVSDRGASPGVAEFNLDRPGTGWGDIAFATQGGRVGIGTIAPGYLFDVNGAAAVNNLTIKGGSDLVEGFDSTTTNLEPGTLMVIDPTHPGQLMPSTSAYDSKVAGIVSGAGGVNPGIKMGQDGVMDGKNPIAMTGRVYVKATATGGKIQPGDLLTTSDLVGHAMRAGEVNTKRGVIIGKAMSSLDEGTGLVLVLVNLQ